MRVLHLITTKRCDYLMFAKYVNKKFRLIQLI